MNIYIPFIIATILLLIVPGPSVSIIVANTVRYNLIAGLKTAIGTVTGSVSMLVIYAFGFDILNNELNFILLAIQWLGIIYLFYIGFVMFKDAHKLNFKVINLSERNFYIQGFFILWSNPKMFVFIGSFIPIFLNLNKDPFHQILVFGLIFCTLGFISDTIYAILVNFMKENFFKKDLSLIGKISGICLILGSIWLLSTKL